MNRLSRRDFLKLSSSFAAGALANGSLKYLEAGDERPNIIILLFDALSAINMSLYGYPRETTPHISRFAERATVNHNHYAAGNFTTPGTASMLMGMYPWKHRAFTQGGLINGEFIPDNMYRLLGEDFYRLAFSQNPWPDRLISQFYRDVERFLPSTAYSLRGNKLVSDKLGNDRYLASLAFEEFLFTLNTDIMGSSLLGYLYKSLALDTILKTRSNPAYPRGTPEVEGFTTYTNEQIFAGVLRELRDLNARDKPYFSYFHLFSPHFPYKPGRRYWKLFEGDIFRPVAKPNHPLGFGLPDEELLSKRTLYDQQVAHVDGEFGHLIDILDEEGILKNSYLVVTSDHGEIFERGFYGHGEVFMYEPAIKIPLLISGPGQNTLQNVHFPTCNIDLLPTLLSIAGKEIPAVLDGQVLPGVGGSEDYERAIFSMYAAENSVFMPLKKAAISMHKGPHKLIAYYGYQGYDDVYEFYNLEEDPEELHDLAREAPATFSQLKAELLEALFEANRPYERV
jgi:arylsulfatase A-like enzyme